MFWILAITIGLLASAYIAWPLLQERAALRNYGLALVVLVPVLSLVLYQSVGTPAGIHVTGTPAPVQRQASHPGDTGMDMESMVAGLEQRLAENPADLEGWVLLGRSYKTIQAYDKAETALLRAIQLAPQDPLILVELAEAKQFLSRSPTVSEEVLAMLEQALTIDPNQQKGLWLMGIAASQRGDDARALELWGRLSEQLEPGSPILASLQQQMDQLRARADTPAPMQAAASEEASGPDVEEDDAPPAADGWSGLRVDVQAPGGLGELPGSAALYVIVRNPAMPGPPLGVARLPRPTFPAIAFISDANSMMENLPISSAEEVEVVARLSMTGNPAAQAGDLQSETVKVELAAVGKVELTLAPN